jgi:hypothetical protein
MSDINDMNVIGMSCPNIAGVSAAAGVFAVVRLCAECSELPISNIMLRGKTDMRISEVKHSSD